MALPRGITGFRHADDEPLPVCDIDLFRSHCYTAARQLAGRVGVVEPPSRRRSTNFASGALEFARGAIAVLLNAHHPLVGFAEPPRGGETLLRFADESRLAELFRNFGTYEVLSARDLERSIGEGDCELLAPAEIDQVRYWRPGRVGDLIFNHWD